MRAFNQTRYILFFVAFALIPGIVCAQISVFSVRGVYNASSAGDSLEYGYHPGVYQGYLRLQNGEVSPFTNVTMTLGVDNLTKIDDSTYAEMTRSSAHWVYPPNFTLASSKKNNWYTDTNPTFNVPMNITRTLNQTIFSQDGYQLVRCNVTFWNTTDANEIWVEIDNYKRTVVNVTVLNTTFWTDLPPYKIEVQNTKQFQISLNDTQEVILGHPYSFSIVLKINRIDPTKTVVYKPVCGISQITFLDIYDPVGPSQTITIPVSSLPPYINESSASIHESVTWGYQSQKETRALLLENVTNMLSPVPPQKSSGIAIFRPSTGYWYFDHNLDGVVNKSFRYGGSTDKIIAGDWNGDGSDGIAIFRPSSGYWYFDNNLDGIVDNSFRYGGSTDQIIKGRWQGTYDGIAIFRPASGYWYFDSNLDGFVDKSFRFGGSTDQIIKGDWDGDGKDGIAIFRPSTGYWYFDYNLDGIVDKSFRYGGSTDQIIVGKWQGTQEGIAIFRPSTGYWYFDYNLDGIVDNSFRYGGSTDQIIKGNWQGTYDGIAIFRPSSGYWYFDYNLDGIVDKAFRYGGGADKIIVGKWA